MDGKEITVWVDASFVATGVALETNGTVIEDACWLRPTNDAQHINLAIWPFSRRRQCYTWSLIRRACTGGFPTL